MFFRVSIFKVALLFSPITLWEGRTNIEVSLCSWYWCGAPCGPVEKLSGHRGNTEPQHSVWNGRRRGCGGLAYFLNRNIKVVHESLRALVNMGSRRAVSDSPFPLYGFDVFLSSEMSAGGTWPFLKEPQVSGQAQRWATQALPREPFPSLFLRRSQQGRGSLCIWKVRTYGCAAWTRGKLC